MISVQSNIREYIFLFAPPCIFNDYYVIFSLTFVRRYRRARFSWGWGCLSTLNKEDELMAVKMCSCLVKTVLNSKTVVL